MNHYTSSSNRRNVRTFIVNLLAYVLLTSQLAPLAITANAAKRRAPNGVSDKSSGAAQSLSSEAQLAHLQKPAAKPAPSIVPLAINIVATKTDNRTVAQPAAPGDTINYTVVIQNTGSTDATNVTFTDTIDANTTLVPNSIVSTPLANNDTYNVIGNVRIQPNAAQGLLANDFNPDNGNATGITASGGTTSTQGGNVVINTDGSFSYNPAPGFAGTDTFTYTLTVTATGKTDTGTVTLNVGNGTATPGTNVIWFIDDSAAPGGDGRLTTPFNCFVGAGCFSAVAADDPGDTIFLFNGAYTAGWPFLANQKLIGQGAGATLASLAGVTAEPYSDALPVTNGNPDNVTMTTVAAATNALTVSAGGILLRGFAVGNTTGAKIFGSSFGTLTAGNTATPDVRLTGTGQALNLTTGAFAATSAFTSVTTTSSPTQGISLAGVTGTVAFNGTQVSGSTTQGILIGTTNADINFGNTTVTAGTDAVSFQNNSSGTRTFGALTATAGGAGSAFIHGAGGGNVTVNNLATLTSGSGNTIDIATSTAGTTVNFAGGATLTKTTAGGTGVNLLNDNGNVTFGGTLTIGTSGARFPSTAVTISGGTGTYSLGAVSIFTNGFAGITATNADGTINSTSGTVDVNAATAINIDGPVGITTLGMILTTVNSTGGTNNVSLIDVGGTLTINGGALSGASGTSFNVGGGTVSSTYAGGITQANNAALVSISGGHNTGTITFNTGTLSATNGTGLQFDNADGTYNFNGPTTLSGGDAGVDIFNGSGGTFTFGTGVAITNPTGIAYREDTSTATVNYNGTITKTNNAANAVDINAKTGGATTFGGAISATTTTANAIDLTNTGGTVTFRGGMVVSTTSGVGFNATGAGTTVNVCDENPCVPASTGALVNTLTSTTGTALNVANTTIGVNNLEFRSISSNGAVSGIVLNNTGAAGGLKVSGNSAGNCGGVVTPNAVGTPATITTPVLADCTGGSILNSTSDGVSLNSTANVSLTRMRIQDSGDSGVFGNNLSGFSLISSWVESNGNTTVAEDSGLEFQTLNGTINVTNSTISNSFEHSINWQTSGGTATFNVSGTTIGPNPVGTGANGFHFNNVTGTNTSTIVVTNSNIDGNQATGFSANVDASAVQNLKVQNTTIRNNNIGINITSGTDSDTNFNVVNNTLLNHANFAIGLVPISTSTNNSQYQGNITGNHIGNGTVDSGSRDAYGIRGDIRGDVDAIISITNNIVRNTDIEPFFIEGRLDADADAQNGKLDLTVTGNDGFAPDDNSAFPFFAVYGARIESRDTFNVCLDFGGSAALSNDAVGTGGLQDWRLRQRDTSTFRLERFVGNGTVDTDVESFMLTQNPDLSTADATHATTYTGVVNGTCRSPVIPPAIAMILTPFDSNSVMLASNKAHSSNSDYVLRAPTADKLLDPKETKLDSVLQHSATDSTATLSNVLTGGLYSIAPQEQTQPRENDGNRTSSISTFNQQPIDSAKAALKAEAIAPKTKANRSTRNSKPETRNLSAATANKSQINPSVAAFIPVKTASLQRLANRSREVRLNHAARKTSAQDKKPLAPTARPMMTYGQRLNEDVSWIHTVEAAAQRQPTTQTESKTANPKKGDKGITPNVANFPITIGTLGAGKSVTITFSVTVNSPLPGGTTQVSNQGTVSGTGFANKLTDDPDTGAADDPTITGITTPPDIFARDARAAEPTSGTSNMLFTVALSAPAPGAVSVNYATANDTLGSNPATGGTCVGGADYETTSGTVNFTAGQRLQTVPVVICSDGTVEPDETLLLNLSGAVGGNIVDAQAVGTITAANPAGDALISELRTSGPAGTNDDFVEIYNNSDSPVTVQADDGSPGVGLFKMGAACGDTPVLVGTIPNGTIVPARGHFLFVGSAYSLANYGGTGAAAGNATLTADIEDDRNLGFFSTTDAGNLSSDTRLDAVGFGTNTGGNCDLLREGTNLQPAGGSTAQYSFVRKLNTGLPQDTNDNTADFLVVATDPTVAVGGNPLPILGAPGPENLTSPIQRNATIKPSLVDPLVSSAVAPNRVRDNSSYIDTLTPSAPNGGVPASNPYTLGTLTFRRKFTNNTGAQVTRLRFRIVDITTTNTPGGAGLADLRTLTSPTVSVTVTGGGMVTVQGLTLEQPTPQPRGGGTNTSVAAGIITMAAPLAAGASINVNIMTGVATGGSFRFFINVEAVP